MKRRDFLKTAAAAPAFLRTGLGANDRIRIGFIGLGGRARWLLANEKFEQAEIVAIADCFLPNLDAAAKLRPEGGGWTKYQDYRRLLEKEKLDAVFVETTTHARVLIAIQAMQAGLDVYAEKPLTLTVAEGHVLKRAVERYKRVLQTGTQQRSIPANVYASELVRKGAIGTVDTVIACNFEAPMVWEPKPEQPVPAGLDWDMWCNQTELRPYHTELQRHWANYRDYDGGGQSWGVTGWGTHSLDQVQCALGTDATGPVEITPEGTGPKAKVMLRYAKGPMLKLEGPRRDHADLGAIFIGSNGRIEIKRGTFTTDLPELRKGAPEDTPEGPGENSFHLRNFFECMRSRKTPNAGVEAGHRSTTLCHLINICRELGRPLRWDPHGEKFIDDAAATALLSRPRRKGWELPKV